MKLSLSRELRVGLHEAHLQIETREANGFAAHPPLLDIAPFLILRATVAGEVDSATGMLVNIKHVDRVLRDLAVPVLRSAFYRNRTPAATVLTVLFGRLAGTLAPAALAALRLGLSPYLSYAVMEKDPAMVELSLRFEFSAAHRLHSEALTAKQNLELFGRCNNPNGHGHNYEMEVTIEGQPDRHSGQLMPIPLLQRIVNEHIIESFDHKHLNLDCAEFAPITGVNPTVENIAQVLYRRLKGHIPAPARLTSIRLWETPKTMCQYSE